MNKIKSVGDHDGLQKLRKIGRRSKIEKKFPCDDCEFKSKSSEGLTKHKKRHHGPIEERKAEIARVRAATSAHNQKVQLGSFCSSLLPGDEKLDVFTGDIESNDPIDEMENEFMRLAISERNKKTDPYYGNVILVTPATVQKEGLASYFNQPMSILKCDAYIGTCAWPGACKIHQADCGEHCSSVATMLLEKDANGNAKYIAFHQELTFSGGSKEMNQKEAFKWESFHTYAAAGQRKTKTDQLTIRYLNQQIEALEGIKGELTEPQIRRAYRLGRSNYCIIGPEAEFEGIQIRFPLQDAGGNLLFKPFTTELALNVVNK